MSRSPLSGSASAQGVAVQLPAELYFPICAHVASRGDLLKLATSSSILQKPSEAVLHSRVTLSSRECGRRFMIALHAYPRFASLVQELRLDFSKDSQTADEEYSEDRYWSMIHDVLCQLSGLKSLTIDVGGDAPFSWLLLALPKNQLTALRCAFVLDTVFLTVLQSQNELRELFWTGTLTSLDTSPTNTTDGKQEATSEQPTELDTLSCCAPSISNPDMSLISIIRQCLPRTSLPHLTSLRTESTALARALVPGRPVKHLWVPGVSPTASISSAYIYHHLASAKNLPSSARTVSSLNANAGSAEYERLLNPVIPQLDLLPFEICSNLLRTIHDFSLSTGPLLSLRISLDLPQPHLNDVLDCISQKLPDLRALGFVPSNALDPLADSDDIKSLKDQTPPPRTSLPRFKHLHTLCLWSCPSYKATQSLENSPTLPALHTVACLHYSPAFEWLCLPINDSSTSSADNSRFGDYHGGIQWNRDISMSKKGIRTRRRLTAVHDPDNLLWLDV